MRLAHYSDKPVIEVQRRPLTTRNSLKPNGFWVSDEDQEMHWAEWCAGENFSLGRYRHDVELIPGHKVLLIETLEALAGFDAEYGISITVSVDYPGGIDWMRVMTQYQGVIISPYQWSFRFGPLWYYGWDCASGCVWDVAAIARISEPAEV